MTPYSEAGVRWAALCALLGSHPRKRGPCSASQTAPRAVCVGIAASRIDTRWPTAPIPWRGPHNEASRYENDCLISLSMQKARRRRVIPRTLRAPSASMCYPSRSERSIHAFFS